MKLIVFVALSLAAIVAAAPANQQTPVPAILRSEFDQDPEGAYKYGFETDNGIVRDEAGELKTIQNEEGKEEQVIAIRGTYSYVDPASGQQYNVVYFADETGFHAEGDHIPKAERK